MIKKIFIFGFFIWSVSAIAAPAPQLPAVQVPMAGNDGYVFVNNVESRNPVMKFCPPNHYYEEIRGRSGKACGPHGKGSGWDGHFSYEDTVQPITAQEFLDKYFGIGIATFVGVSPTSNYSNNSVIFYRMNHK